MAWELITNLSGGGAPAGPAPWVRPTDWLTLPTVTAGDQKFVGLYAVDVGDSNFVAMKFSGACTVDWGDGSASENFSAFAQAEHNYVFTDLDVGTLTSTGYRQAIITVTMQASNTLTSVNLFLKHTQSSLSNGYGTGWLDIRMAGASINSLAVSGSSATIVQHRRLQRFEFIGPSACTTLAHLFNGCNALAKLELDPQWAELVSNFTSTFALCRRLREVPLFDMSATTTMAAMFQNASSLELIPLFDTPLNTSLANTFQGCTSLREIPLLDTANVVTLSSTFNGCNSLEEMPLISMVKVTSTFNTFTGCHSLREIPLFVTPLNVTWTSMFNSCFSLRTIPLLDCSSGTGFGGMFALCSSLEFVPQLDTSSGLAFGTMFNGCSSLRYVPALDVSAGTAFVNMFNNCPSLASAALTGTAQDMTYTNCMLSADELDAIYTNLGTGTGRTITVTGNWGTAGHTPSIATAKGWTVTV